MVDSQDFLSSCLPNKGIKKKPLSKFLSEGGEFKVFVECPTGLVLEGTFPKGSTLTEVISESSQIYLAGYDECFNLTKQGDSVPSFHEMYFRKVHLYEVQGVKTLVIKAEVDRKFSQNCTKFGKSVSLFSIAEETKNSADLEDL